MRIFQAMRNLAAYEQYDPPPDITAPGGLSFTGSGDGIGRY
jgi:hypothetical protein